MPAWERSAQHGFETRTGLHRFTAVWPFLFSNMEQFNNYDITFEVDGHQRAEVAHNGGFVIQIPTAGAQFVGTDADGVAKNVPGQNEDQDLDRSFLSDTLVKPGDVLLLWRDSESSGQWTSDWPEDGNTSQSRNRHCLPVAFVAYPPTPGQLFPPAVGRADNPLLQFGRTHQLLKSHIKLDRLPRLFKLSEWNDEENSPLTRELLENSCRPFAGEYVSKSWGTASVTPGVGNEGYGQYVAAWTARRLLYLVSDATDEEKIDVAAGVCQRGLSLAGAYMDGKCDMANGGHFQGRTAMMIAAGVMLGIGPMADPRWLGNRFQERHAFYRDGRSWWHDPEWVSLWQRTSDYRWGGFPVRLENDPSQWTEGHGGEKWAMQGYYQPTCASNIGTAIAMRLMKREQAIGVDFVRGILDQYMVGPSADAKNQLLDAGVNIAWGDDYPKPWTGTGIQRQAYDQLKAAGHL